MAAKKLGPEFTYDLSEFLKVDPNLVHYEEKTAVATGMKEPRGITVDAIDNLYVAGDRTVRWYGPDGLRIGEFKTADEPRCLAVALKDKTATLYVAMRDHVELYDVQGKRLAAWETAGPSAVFTGISVDASGIAVPNAGTGGVADQVFVADAGDRVVLHYEGPSGRLVRKIGEATSSGNAEGFIVPSPYFDVAVRPGGQIWVTNPGKRRIELYSYNGEQCTVWGKASPKIDGFCGCCNPTHLALLSDGRLVTSEKGLPRVKIYTQDGELASVVAPPSAFAEGETGLAVATDSLGRILVLDPVAGKVRYFGRKGA